ncbi:Uncharacterised protein [Coprococcus eutactus]|jgi:glycosyltransferase involved in cell wall biosynthesis|nr:Uncharacterised protein [Coprococcus eutactus]
MFNKVIYIVKTDLHYYPPCMMQIRYLKKCGVRVEVWFASSNESALTILDKEQIPYVCLGESPRVNSLIGKLKNWMEFRRNVNRQLNNISQSERENTLLWVGTAESAIPLYGVLQHYHYNLTMLELLDGDKNKFKRTTFGKLAKKAEAIVACEVTRAYIMKYWFGLKKLPYVMPNKPYELGTTKNAEPSCDKTKQAIDVIRGKKFIIFQGIFQKVDYMKALATALSQMDSDYYIVLMGFDLYKTNAYEKLKKIYERVIELSSLPAPLHLEVTSHAQIGLVFYDDFSLNQAFCAPNKIYEYSGFGIPMIANKIPGLENTVGKFNAGKCVEFESKQLMKAIKEIDDNYEQYSANSLSLYNAVDNESTINDIIRDIKIEKE